MSDTFTASNGIKVGRDLEDDLFVRNVPGVVGAVAFRSEVPDALREFFLHEAGVWQDPETGVLVIPNVTDGASRRYISALIDGRMHGTTEDDLVPGSPMGNAVAAYRATHPGPRPWHDAKPGEVWAITTENVADEVAVQRTDTGDWQYCDGLAYRDHELKIETARRIWPEVTP